MTHPLGEYVTRTRNGNLVIEVLHLTELFTVEDILRSNWSADFKGVLTFTQRRRYELVIVEPAATYRTITGVRAALYAATHERAA